MQFSILICLRKHFNPSYERVKKLVLMTCLFYSSYIFSADSNGCRPKLWPVTSAIMDANYIVSANIIKELEHSANQFVMQSNNPLPILHSSGEVNIHNLQLINSRKAFMDADRAAVLALTYNLTHKPIYLHKAQQILLDWSIVNQPTGNPIDETRLEGMIWAYDLIACELSTEDKNQITTWFSSMHQKKLAWKFGPKTTKNNYRIHQLKMLLLLDKILNYKENWQQDTESVKKYAKINLDLKSGVSLDFTERTALYYHNYVLQPWIEISLITSQDCAAVKQAFAFLCNRILSHQITNEFAHSQVPIDALRAKGGFEYAATNGVFDIKKAAPTIIAYYTLVKLTPEPELWKIQKQAKKPPWMVFLKMRRVLWDKMFSKEG